MDPGCWEKGEPDRLRVGQGGVGRFVSGSGWEIWHAYGGGLDRR